MEQKSDQVMVPRQFLDLGPSVETDEVSNSSSEERTRSGTPPNNNNNNTSNGKHEMERVNREESPESENQCWGPNKAQKLNNNSSNKSMEQSTEATMRKARVSVRARSEAPMVS